MSTEYSFILVVLSYVISVIGSYTALELGANISTAKTTIGKLTWLSSASIALGGGAIWAMHFIGMLAYKMPIPVTYDLSLTLLSLIAPIVVCGVGLALVSQKPTTLKLLLAGVLAGSGIVVMHYTGTTAMIMAATITYNMPVVALSIVIAIFAATAALWLAFNVRSTAQRAGSAFIMGIAVCGMHYTGMASMTMTPATVSATITEQVLSNEILGLYVFFFVMALMFLLAITSLFKPDNQLI